MLLRKSKMQFVKKGRNTQNAINAKNARFQKKNVKAQLKKKEKYHGS
jgi:hypothetical protein